MYIIYEYKKIIKSSIIIIVIIYEFAVKDLSILLFSAKRERWPTPDGVWVKMVK